MLAGHSQQPLRVTCAATDLSVDDERLAVGVADLAEARSQLIMRDTERARQVAYGELVSPADVQEYG